MNHANIASTKARWNELTRKLKTQGNSTTDGATEPKTPKKTPVKRKTATKEENGDEIDTPTTKRAKKPTKKAEQIEQSEQDEGTAIKEEQTDDEDY